MARFSLKTRILVVFGILALVVVMCACWSWQALGQVRSTVVEASWVRKVPMPQVAAMRASLLAMRGSYRDAAVERDPAKVAEAAARYRSFRQRFVQSGIALEKLTADEPRLAAWHADTLAIRAASDRLLPLFDELVAAAEAREHEQARTLFLTQVLGQSAALSTPLKHLVAQAQDQEKASLQAVAEARQLLAVQLAVLLASGILFALFAWYLVRRALLVTLGAWPEEVKVTLEALSSGQLEPPLPVQCAEGSVMASARHLSGTWRQVVDDLRCTVISVTAVADQSAEAACAIQSATAAGTAGLQDVSTALNHVSRSFDLSRETLREGAVMADEAARRVGGGRDAIENTRTILQDMAGHIAVIASQARQTHLLALNAAVEAAGVGAAGAGLKVVAQSVRELAESSSQAAREVDELMNATLRSASHAAERLEQGCLDGRALAGQLVLMERNGVAQGDVIRQLEETLTQLVAAAQHNGDHAAGVRDMARELTRQARELGRELTYFSGA